MADSDDGSERTAGLFSFMRGARVLLGVHDDPTREEATELHESIHSQLSHLSTHGRLTQLLTLYMRHATTAERRELVSTVVGLLHSSQRYVQEVIATTAAVLFLADARGPTGDDPRELVAPSYQQYLEPLERHRDTFFNDPANSVEGTINLGLMVLCSPIFHAFASIEMPFDTSQFELLLKDPQIDPRARLHRILDVLSTNGLTAARLIPEVAAVRAKELLASKGIQVCEARSSDEGMRLLTEFVNSPLMRSDVDGTESLLGGVQFSEEAPQIEDFISDISAFAVRTFGPVYVTNDSFAEVFDFLEKRKDESAEADLVPVLEFRAEDIIPSPDKETHVIKLNDGEHLCTLFPAQGYEQHRTSAILANVQIAEYWERAERVGFDVLLDSSGYDFMRGRWCGLKARTDHWVVLPMGSVELVNRVLLLHPFRKKVRIGVVTHDEPHMSLLFMWLPYVLPKRDCFAIVPCSENLWARIIRETTGRGPKVVQGDQLGSAFPMDRLARVAYHLATLGWATENVADENATAFVPFVD